MRRRRRTTRFPVVVALCLLTSGCGDDRPSPAQSESVEDSQRESAPAPVPVPIPAAPDLALPTQAEVDVALVDLSDDEATKREAAVRVLRAADWSGADIMRLALRIVKWDEDTGLLADLLANHPDEMLPPLLHRIGHSASMHRAQICRALGRKRTPNDAATAVLMVRALLDPDEHVRVMARLAMTDASPAGLPIVQAHRALYRTLSDGSMIYVSSSLLLGPTRGSSSPYGRFLRMAMRTEAERFGTDTVLRVMRFFTEMGEADETRDQALDEIQPYISIDDGTEARAAGEILASVGAADPMHLRKLAGRPGFLGGIGRALGILGPKARSAAEDLFRAYRATIRHPDVSAEAEADPREPPRRGEVWELYGEYTPTADVLWGILRTGVKPQTIQQGLVDLLESDLTWIDRSMIEAALRCMRPNGRARERLIDLAMSATQPSSAAAVSALRVVAWCEQPFGRLLVWLQEIERLRPVPRGRPTRLRIRTLRKQIDMSVAEKAEVALRLERDLERWSAPSGD